MRKGKSLSYHLDIAKAEIDRIEVRLRAGIFSAADGYPAAIVPFDTLKALAEAAWRYEELCK